MCPLGVRYISQLDHHVRVKYKEQFEERKIFFMLTLILPKHKHDKAQAASVDMDIISR